MDTLFVEYRYGFWCHSMYNKPPSFTQSYKHSMHCPILSSPCSVGLGWPQLPEEAQPPSDGPHCWLVVVLYNHSVWQNG